MKSKSASLDNPFVGTWHIYDMSNWDEDYFNMEVQAYIQIEPNGSGEFQFGLVCGSLNGKIKKTGDKVRFSFTWEGSDEMDEANGRGWIELGSANDEIDGFIDMHQGDDSTFNARKES